MALVLALVCSTGIVLADNLTVADGTDENAYVPYHGSYADYYQRTQILYPADQLQDMKGAAIKGMTFYVSSDAGKSLGDMEYNVALTEIADASFASYTFAVDVINVVGVMEVNGMETSMVEVKFSSNYNYGGGNLLVEIKTKVRGNTYGNVYFYGKDQSVALCLNGHNSSNPKITSADNKGNFLPKTTFEYAAGGVSCDKPEGVMVSIVEARYAAANWDKNTGVEQVQYALVAEGEALVWSEATTDASKEFTGLTPETNYTLYVRSYCDETSQSAAISTTFSTPKSCYAPTDLTISNIDANTANLGWLTSGQGESSYQYVCVKAGETPDWSKAIDNNSMFVELTGLNPVTSYDVYVRSVCGEDDFSEVAKETFTTICGTITELPMFEDFSGGSFPECWSAFGGTVSVLSKYMYFSLGGGESIVVELPAFADHISTLSISLSYSTGDYNGTLEIGYLETKDDPTTFKVLGSFGKTKEYEKISVNLREAPTEAAFIALRASSDDAVIIYVDDVKVFVTPCEVPVNLTVEEITNNSAVMKWEDPDGTAWDIEVSHDGSSWFARQYAIDGAEITLGYLEADADYAVRVMRVEPCVSEFTEWFEFHTAKTPTNVEAVEGAKSAIKRIENGQMVIIRDGVRYNAIGVEVE